MKPLWLLRRTIEKRYQHAIQTLLGACFSNLDHYDSWEEFVAKLDAFLVSDAFREFAWAASEKMVTHLFDDVGRTWREAAIANGSGRELYELLMADLANTERGLRLQRLIRENEWMLSHVPKSIADEISKHAAAEALKGKRYSDIVDVISPLLSKRSKSKAKMIARTACAQTQTALVQSDCEMLGLDWYIWRSTHDERVRYSHEKMDGVICSWKHPPNPERLFTAKKQRPIGNYAPGCTVNCRCFPEPIIVPSQLQGNTFQVCTGDKIVRMKKGDVLKLLS